MKPIKHEADQGTGLKMLGRKSTAKTVGAETGSYDQALNRTIKAGTVPNVPYATAVGKSSSHRGTPIGSKTKADSPNAKSASRNQ